MSKNLQKSIQKEYFLQKNCLKIVESIFHRYNINMPEMACNISILLNSYLLLFELSTNIRGEIYFIYKNKRLSFDGMSITFDFNKRLQYFYEEGKMRKMEIYIEDNIDGCKCISSDLTLHIFIMRKKAIKSTMNVFKYIQKHPLVIKDKFQ